jgi:holo-[acyl-carrier protein] synthase
LSVFGIGTDIVSVDRITQMLDRHGERFLSRCFRPGEIVSSAPASVAGRWAAKEAFLKALGTDVRGIPYRSIEVVKSAHGPVKLVLHGRANDALAAGGGAGIHLTISHEREFAVATVIIEG